MKVSKVFKNLEELNDFTSFGRKKVYIFTEEDGNLTKVKDFILKNKCFIIFYKKDNLNTENLVGFVEFKSVKENYYFNFYFEIENEKYENFVKKFKNKKEAMFIEENKTEYSEDPKFGEKYKGVWHNQDEMIYFKHNFKF